MRRGWGDRIGVFDYGNMISRTHDAINIIYQMYRHISRDLKSYLKISVKK